MANLRPVLIIGLLFLGYMIWVQWQQDYGPAPQAPTPSPSPSAATEQLDVPTSGGTAELPSAEDLPAPIESYDTVDAGPASAPIAEAENLVKVRTDVLEALIDPVGGTVVAAKLLNYPVDLDRPEEKVRLLVPGGDQMFIAQSGLLSKQAAPNHTTTFETTSSQFEMGQGQEELRVPFRWRSDDGLEVTKTFVFRAGRYELDISYQVVNRSAATWTGSRYDQLQRRVPGDRESGGFTQPERYSFFGIGFYNPEEKFQKIDFDDVGDEPYRVSTRDGWLAMIQHYFFAAWIPPAEEEATYTTQVIEGDGWPRYIAREVSPPRQVAPGGSAEFSSRLYLGPKIQDDLPDIAQGLEYTVNYGIFTVFSKPLFWLLEKIHDVVGNWGWAIVILTILIKAAFFKLTEAQYRSTARMRKLQPRIEQLKERYGDDKQRMSQAMMEMYKKEKVNPLGG
ncbi:MAG: membrane protein insertase YidC, partial [Xanthomonadales bacterium]|nr:membrane protein insertase YidC [Xanthomonadales bacterium]